MSEDENDIDDVGRRTTNEQKEDGYEYELIGVTVHTGTADGGHYYSFIRDRLSRNEVGQDQWYVDVAVLNFPNRTNFDAFYAKHVSINM